MTERIMIEKDLTGQVALVAGGTRGAGRAMAQALAAAGARVYISGRSTRAKASEMQRPETLEETVALIAAAGGWAKAVCTDHTQPPAVAQLINQIEAEQGQLHLLVNDVWGGDPFTEWVSFWEHDLPKGLHLIDLGLKTHLITAHAALPLMLRSGGRLILEITDGINARYRGTLFYDLVKSGVIRIALGLAEELRPHGIAVLALSPGFLRSEAMLDHFGVDETNWRDAIAQDPHFVASETPALIGQAAVALATDPNVLSRSGQALATWNLAREYGLNDSDGSRPDWGTYARTVLGLEMN